MPGGRGSQCSHRTFGVEEEYLILGPDGAPRNAAEELVAATPELGELTEREFLACQLEIATPICHEAGEADEVLQLFRTVMGRAAGERGLVLAGTGVPPAGGDARAHLTGKRRYLDIGDDMRGLVAHHYATGLHVHVEVPSPDAGVDVIARLARWAPALIAMSANSPLWCGEDTGFASWRHVTGLVWPAAGYPPPYATAADYHRGIEDLIGSGILLDPGMITWVVRLSHHYPTVELRIADAQLGAADAVDFALIVRALVVRALADGAEEGAETPVHRAELVRGAIWRAARDGLGGPLVDPVTGRSSEPGAMIAEMLGTVEAELDATGDRARIDRYLQRLGAAGPAGRQTAAFAREGMPGLLELLRAENAGRREPPVDRPVGRDAQVAAPTHTIR